MFRLISRPKAFLRAVVVDDGVVGDEGAAFGNGVVCLADQHPLFFEVPIVQDVAHQDDVGLWAAGR